LCPIAGGGQAAVLISESLAALTHGQALTDVKIDATATYTAGSDEESGPAILEASGHLASRVTLYLSAGQRLQIQDGISAAWSGLDGVAHAQALQNSLGWAAWFFPALGIGGLAQDSTYTVTYIGPETYAGTPVQHLSAVRHLSGQGDPATMSLLLSLTSTDVYLDGSSLLPVALKYNTHPDDNALQSIPVTVEFADYRSTSGGVQAPFHVRQFLQGNLVLDITVNSVAINPGLPGSDFQID